MHGVIVGFAVSSLGCFLVLLCVVDGANTSLESIRILYRIVC